MLSYNSSTRDAETRVLRVHFEASLGYVVSSKLARATWQNPSLRNKEKEKRKERMRKEGKESKQNKEQQNKQIEPPKPTNEKIK